MKIPCDMIRDLLPLYYDKVCSEESRQNVEEHLLECESCREELRLIGGNMESAPARMKDKKIAKAAGAAWKRGKTKAFLKGALAVLLLALISVFGYVGLHLASSAKGNDMDALARKASDYFDYRGLSIEKLEQRGDYLAALCRRKNGKLCMCVFRRDSLFENRWRVIGGNPGVVEGGMGSWNAGEPGGDAVLVFVGADLPGEACWYTFYNGGIRYLCSVEESTVLDLFVILDHHDINGDPVLLDADYQEIPR